MTLKDKYSIISYVSEMKDEVLSRCIYLYIGKNHLIRERIDTREKLIGIQAEILILL